MLVRTLMLFWIDLNALASLNEVEISKQGSTVYGRFFFVSFQRQRKVEESTTLQYMREISSSTQYIRNRKNGRYGFVGL
jgi:hypothetical protein